MQNKSRREALLNRYIASPSTTAARVHPKRPALDCFAGFYPICIARSRARPHIGALFHRLRDAPRQRSAVDALDLRHNEFAAQFRHDRHQIFEIRDFDIENDVAEIDRSGAKLHMVDVCPVLADHRRDLT